MTMPPDGAEAFPHPCLLCHFLPELADGAAPGTVLQKGLSDGCLEARGLPTFPKPHLHPGNCSEDTSLSRLGRGAVVFTFMATIVPGTGFLSCARHLHWRHTRRHWGMRLVRVP